MAISMSLAFRSGSFASAMERSCSLLRVPTFFLFGTAEPFSRPKALRISTAAGGVLVMKVKLLSE